MSQCFSRSGYNNDLELSIANVQVEDILGGLDIIQLIEELSINSLAVYLVLVYGDNGVSADHQLVWGLQERFLSFLSRRGTMSLHSMYKCPTLCWCLGVSQNTL